MNRHIELTTDRAMNGSGGMSLPTLPADVAAALRDIVADDIRPRPAMPPRFYTDPEVMATEIETLFRHGWICVGRADEIPNSGDFVATTVVGEPLVMVRGHDGEVRVLSNVCRHRGTVIAEGTGSSRQLLCPYHNWSYHLDGELKRAPLMETVDGFDPSRCALPRLKIENWMGWIFVNLSGAAEPLNPQLVGLDPYTAAYHNEEMRTVRVDTEYWPVNWKGLAENFMEGYHLTPVHLKTLHPMCPTSLCQKIEGDAAYTGYKARYSDSFEGRPPFHPDMSDEQQRMSMMVWIYPGFVAALSPNSTVYMSVSPTTPDEVQTRWGCGRPG